MRPKFVSEELIFHGSRDDFYEFDPEFVGTGERAGPGIGFHFTDSLKGAAAHAERYVRKAGNPLVYVCTVNRTAQIIYRGVSPSKHSSNIQVLWQKKLPMECAKLYSSSNWFNSLENHYSQILTTNFQSSKIEAKNCYLLKQAGIDIIKNYEEGYQDAYLHGDVILVLNHSVITIVEKLNVHDIFTEVIGTAREYHLASSKEFLGDTNISSYLRRSE